MRKNKKCNTPIWDFVNQYKKSGMSRFHMPGHKGIGALGCESMDITEIKGADSLYEADGIIAESEKIASELFGSGATFYSTEGSSQCIRTMLYLAMMYKNKRGEHTRERMNRPVIVAARNVHKAFIYAASLLDFDVVWLWPEEQNHSLCSCPVAAATIENTLKTLSEEGRNAAAVYVTSPDYLGKIADVKTFAEVCHAYDTLLLVDNAHGAYLHFLEPSMHPLDLGADMCCDSAHKTLPVLTGGAYLHINKRICKELANQVKPAMCLFGSTSPSYLMLCSLDLCNLYLMDEYRIRLANYTSRLEQLRSKLKQAGWQVEPSDPLRITIAVSKTMQGGALSEMLRVHGVECEYADEDYIVFMLTPDNEEKELEKLEFLLTEMLVSHAKDISKEKVQLPIAKAVQMMSIREAMFCASETVRAEDAKGCICRTPTVSCPPAIPIAVPGERIEENAIELFKYYGIDTIDVVRRYI